MTTTLPDPAPAPAPASVTDERLSDILDQLERFDRTFKPDAVDRLIDREKAALAEELRRARAALRRVEVVRSQLADRTQDPAAQMWASELRAAVTGTRWLYRCPVHGDRARLADRHERGVRCGEPLAVWDRHPGGSCCSRTAVLIGEVAEGPPVVDTTGGRARAQEQSQARES